MSSCGNRSSEVDARCFEIAAELRGLGQYVSFEKVLAVLLQRYGVVCFEALQCGRVDQLPTLTLLMAIDSKVETFLAAWFAVRSVLTLRDLESDCAQFLRSFHVPTLHSLHPTHTPHTPHPPYPPHPPHTQPGVQGPGTDVVPGGKRDRDPSEIDLETEAEEPAAAVDVAAAAAAAAAAVVDLAVDEQPAPDDAEAEAAEADAELCEYAAGEHNSFEAFGVGPLLQHPRVAPRFYPLSHFRPDQYQYALLDSDGVMQHLLEYLVQQKAQAGVTSSVQLAEFAAYLCEQQGVYCPAEAGVLLQGSLQAEVLALQHALGKRYSLFVEVSKRELVHYNQQMRDMEGGSGHGQGGRKKSRRGGAVEVVEEAPLTETEVGSGEAQPVQSSSSSSTVPQSPPAEPFSSRLAVHPPGNLSLSLDGAGDGVTVVGPEALQSLLPLVSTYTGDLGGLGGPGQALPLHQWDGRQVGRWGEALVYQYLLSQHSLGGAHGCGCEVEWLNQHEESRACYDLILRHASGPAAASCFSTSHHASPPGTAGSATAHTGAATAQDTVYVEVKSSRYSDRNVFELSLWEWQFACAEWQYGGRVPYHIYRVFAAGDAARVRIVIITDLMRLITEGRVKLCLAV